MIKINDGRMQTETRKERQGGKGREVGRDTKSRLGSGKRRSREKKRAG